MDISCPTCGEPWDAYHMRNDEPHEWDIPKTFLNEFLRDGSRFSGPTDPVKEAAEAAGWSFSTNSVLSFTRCPNCSGDESKSLPGASDRRYLAAFMADLLGDDDDGLAAELNDMGLFT